MKRFQVDATIADAKQGFLTDCQL